MPKIIILVGLPSSGKTYHGNLLESTYHFIFIDNVKYTPNRLFKTIKQKKNIIISDIFLCREQDREWAKYWLEKNAPDYEIEWIFFENNPQKCLNNLNYRNKKVKQLILDLTKTYVIPDGEKVQIIWQKQCGHFTINTICNSFVIVAIILVIISISVFLWSIIY